MPTHQQVTNKQTNKKSWWCERVPIISAPYNNPSLRRSMQDTVTVTAKVEFHGKTHLINWRRSASDGWSSSHWEYRLTDQSDTCKHIPTCHFSPHTCFPCLLMNCGIHKNSWPDLNWSESNWTELKWSELNEVNFTWIINSFFFSFFFFTYLTHSFRVLKMTLIQDKYC